MQVVIDVAAIHKEVHEFHGQKKYHTLKGLLVSFSLWDTDVTVIMSGCCLIH